MDYRVRSGIIVGLGATAVTIYLAAIGASLCGPVLAIFCGLSVGLQVLNSKVTLPKSPAWSGAMAGLYAGALMIIGQFIGGFILMDSSAGQSVRQQAMALGAGYSETLYVIMWTIVNLIFGLIDLGIVVGVAASIVHWRAPKLAQQSPIVVPTPPAYVRPVEIPEPWFSPPSGPIPSTYPPPPEYYGKPSIQVVPPSEDPS